MSLFRKLFAMLAIPLGGLAAGPASAQADFPAGVVVRIAELEIDPGQLESYKIAVKEETWSPA